MVYDLEEVVWNFFDECNHILEFAKKFIKNIF